MNNLRIMLASVALLSLGAASLVVASNTPALEVESTEVVVSQITRAEIEAAQQAWGNALIAIGAAHVAGEDYRGLTLEHANKLYAFEMGPVLFKPTVATAPHQFRTTFEDAISYFVGGHIEGDTGFALRPWVNVEFQNEEIFINGNFAVAMGNYFFTAADGERIKVEYTKGYIRDEDGNLRINLQHSSLPFVPAAS